MQDDEAIITAYVRVVKDPTGVLWHSFQKCVLSGRFDRVKLTFSFLQLRLEEGDWNGGIEEPGSYMLLELTFTIAVFHKCFPQGTARQLRSPNHRD